MDNTETEETVDNSSTLDSLITNKETTTEETSTEETSTEETTTKETTTVGFADLLEGLPEGLKDNASLGKFESFDDLAKSYIEQEKLVGRKTTIPDSEASDDDWNDFYKNAGRPETVNEYGIEVPDDLKGARSDAALQAAHDSGLTKRQAEAFMGKMFELESGYADTAGQAMTDARDAAKGQLDEAWGNDFDIEAGKVVALQKQLGVFDQLEADGSNGNPNVLLAFSKMAKQLKVESAMDNIHESTDNSAESSINDLREEMMQANRDGDIALRDKLNRKLDKVYDKAYGD